MSDPVRLNIQGQGSIWRQPERVVLSFQVRNTTGDQASASTTARQAAQKIHDKIKALEAKLDCDNGPDSSERVSCITQWSSGPLRTSSRMEIDHAARNQTATTDHDPFRFKTKAAEQISSGDNNHNTVPTKSLFGSRSENPGAASSQQHTPAPMRRVYEANVSLSVTFRDFDQFNVFAGELSETPLVSVNNIRWALSAETTKSLQDQSIKLAYEDALAKAMSFAQAMGKTNVTPVEVIHRESRHQPSGTFQFGGGGSAQPPAHLATVPEDISTRVDCEVTFEAN